MARECCSVLPTSARRCVYRPESRVGLLTDMYRGSLERVHEAKARVPEAALQAAVATAAPFPRLTLQPTGFDVIAELKLRSPSLGDLSTRTLDPVARLESYAAGGAAVCSILTEPTRFDGDLAHLRLAADTLSPFAVPAMRKDFLVDRYQVLEARVHGASGVLLIVRMVPLAQLVEMLDCAADIGLFVLLEAFDAADLAVARQLAQSRRGRNEQVLMGLNCRDLETLQIELRTFRVASRPDAAQLAERCRKWRDFARRRCDRGRARLPARTGWHEP